MRLTPEAYRPLIEGAAELTPHGDKSLVRRLPVHSSQLIVNEDLLLVADMAAGARLVFTTDAHSLELDVRTYMPSEFTNPVAPFDVVVGGALVARQAIEGDAVLTVDGLGSRDKTIEVWLPHFGATELGDLTLAGASKAMPSPASRPHWITYGSSITQCKESDGPSEAWPSIVAAARGWRLTNLGFGGQCHLDPVVGRYIRDTPARVISLCLGVNVWFGSSFSERTLGPAVVGFIQTIRDGHKTTPILVSTPIASPDREEKANQNGLTLSRIRSIVHEAVVQLQHRGDEWLHLANGLDILGIQEGALLEDGVHPGPEGYRFMARKLTAELEALL